MYIHGIYMVYTVMSTYTMYIHVYTCIYMYIHCISCAYAPPGGGGRRCAADVEEDYRSWSALS